MREATWILPRTLQLNRKQQTVTFALILVMLFVLDTWAMYALLTSREVVTYDFAARWAGARAYFLDGLDPYSDEATRWIQQIYYGRPARPGEDQALFAYPFYTVFVIAPLIWLPYAWATAIWLAALKFGLVAALIMLLDIYGWRPSPTLLVFMGVWTITFYPEWRGLLLGQFVLLVFFFLTLALWALVRGRDGLAGAALALTTIKPQVVFLVIPFLLLWAISQRRWRFIWAFTLILGGLFVASFLMLPGWLSGFVYQLTLYPSYVTEDAVLLIIAKYIFSLPGTAGQIVLTLVALAGLGWAWWREVRSGWATFHWTLGLTLVISQISALRTATPNYVVFLIPLVPIFHDLYRRAGAPVLVGVQMALFLGLWALFLVTRQGIAQDLVMYLPLPLFMLLVLLWDRKGLARPLQGMEGRGTT